MLQIQVTAQLYSTANSHKVFGENQINLKAASIHLHRKTAQVRSERRSVSPSAENNAAFVQAHLSQTFKLS